MRPLDRFFRHYAAGGKLRHPCDVVLSGGIVPAIPGYGALTLASRISEAPKEDVKPHAKPLPAP